MKKTPDYFLSEADLEGYDMVEILHELDSILDSGATLVEVEGFGNYDAERVEQEMACYGLEPRYNSGVKETTIDYGKIYDRVDSFLQTRDGLANPKNTQDYIWFVRELTGIFCGASYENDLNTHDTLKFFDLVEDNYITNINLTGKLCNVADLINQDIINHPLYNITEFTLMNYKPGNVQVGPGEFFFCFYDKGSTFGIDNMAGYDVIIDRVTTELKKLGTNFTTPELFDKYAASDAVQRLLVIKPISNAKKPRIRSQYACTLTTEWRKAFYHKNNTTLALKGNSI